MKKSTEITINNTVQRQKEEKFDKSIKYRNTQWPKLRDKTRRNERKCTAKEGN